MKRKKTGFTLVEMLVVIAIIAILAAILLPALSESLAEEKSAIRVMASSPDRQHVAVGLADGSLRVWTLGPKRDKVSLDIAGKPVSSVGFSEDARFVVAGYEDGQIRVWEHAAGGDSKIALVQAHSESVTGVALDASQSRLFSTSSAGTLRIWKWPPPAERVLGRDAKSLAAVVATKRGDLVACGGEEGLLRLMELQSQSQPTAERLTSAITALALSREEDLVAIGMQNGAVVFRNRAGKEARLPLPASGSRVVSLAIHPAGKQLAVSSADGRLTLWPLAPAPPQNEPAESGNSAENVASNPQTPAAGLNPPWLTGTVRQVVYLPDDGLVTAGNDNKIRIWNSSQDSLLRELDGGAAILHLAITADGRMLAAACADQGVQLASAGTTDGKTPRGQLHLWNFADGKLLKSTELPATARGLVYSPLGNSLAVAGENAHVRVFRSRDGVLLQDIACQAAATSLAFLASESTLILGHADGLLSIHEIALEQVVQAHEGALTSVSVSPSGQRILTAGGEPAAIRLWDAASLTNPLAQYAGGTGHVRAASLGADGKYVIAVFDDPANTVCLWEAAGTAADTLARQPVARFAHPSPVRTAVVTPDGQRVVVGGDGEFVHLWDIATVKEVARLRSAERVSVQSLAVNVQNGTIVGGLGNRSAQVWALPQASSGSPEAIATGESQRTIPLEPVPPPQQVPDPRLANDVKDHRLGALSREMREAEDDGDRQEVLRQWLQARRERTAGVIDQSLRATSDPAASSKARDKLALLQKQESELLTALERLQKLQLQADGAKSSEERAEARAELQDARQVYFSRSGSFLQATGAIPSATYASGHPNQAFALRTEFRFDQRSFPPVRLAAHRDWVAAARAAACVPDENGDVTVVPGRVDVWDIYSQQLLRSWDHPDLKSIDVLQLTSGAALTGPGLWEFEIASGKAQLLRPAGCWAISPEGILGGRTLLAVGTAGQPQGVSRVLEFLDANDFAPRPAGYDGYCANVTAVALANKHPWIVFAVREQANHRVFLWDALQPEATRLRPLETHPHKRSWFDPDGSPGPLGVTSLAIAPEDDFLLMQGQYEDAEYRLSLLQLQTGTQYTSLNTAPAILKEGAQYLVRKGDGLEPAPDGTPRTRSDFTVPAIVNVQPEEPFVHGAGNAGLGFIRKAASASMPATPDANSAVPTYELLAVLDKGAEVSVVDLSSMTQRCRVPVNHSPRGRSQRAFSDDRRWLVTGDDSGYVVIWHLETGESIPLTPDGRPAHSGPLAGLAFSAVSSASGEPDYLVTLGEENTLKLWLIHDRLEALRTRPVAKLPLQPAAKKSQPKRKSK